MTNLTEAVEDRITALLVTQRVRLVKIAVEDKKYSYLLRDALVNCSMDEVNELLREIACDHVDSPWF